SSSGRSAGSASHSGSRRDACSQVNRSGPAARSPTTSYASWTTNAPRRDSDRSETAGRVRVVRPTTCPARRRARHYDQRMPIRTNRTLTVLAGLFALEFALLAIAPVSRSDWLLENALSGAAVGALAFSYRRFRFSRLSYALLFVFLS